MFTALFQTGLSLVYLIIGFVFVAAIYIFDSIAHMKALRALGYQNPWMAWVPYGEYYAYADAVTWEQDKIKMFGFLEVPVMLFKVWWVIPLLLNFILKEESASMLIRLVNVLFLGYTYTRMYSILEGKTEKETAAIGCVSGLIPIIAACKFIML